MDWFTQDQVVLRTIAYARHGRTELKAEARISLVTGTRWSEGEELKKASSRNTKSLTPTLKAEKTAPFPSAKSFMAICLMTEKAGYLVIAMGRSALLWKGWVSNYRLGNLPTFCATPSLVTL